MKITSKQENGNATAFEITYNGAEDLFNSQSAIIQELIEQRATLHALNVLLTEVVAELRQEDVDDVKARFENYRIEKVQSLRQNLTQLFPQIEFSPET